MGTRIPVNKLSGLSKSQYRSSCLPLFCSCFKKMRSTRKQVFFEISVHKNFAISRGKHLCWSLFLIKLQACNFPVNICKIFKNSLFHKTPPMVAFEKFINFPRICQWQRDNRFIILINTAE